MKNLAVDVHAGMGEVYLILNHAKEVLQSVDVNASPQAVDVEQTQSERVLSGIQIMDIPYPSTHSLREAMTLIPGPGGGCDRRTALRWRPREPDELSAGWFQYQRPADRNLATTVSVEAVSSLDYLSGRYSPEYGQGSAGTLQIKTQTGDDQFRYSATNFIPGREHRGGLAPGRLDAALEFLRADC